MSIARCMLHAVQSCRIFNMLISFILIIVCFNTVRSEDYSQFPPVYGEISSGLIKGFKYGSPQRNSANIYLGIPYAESTAGSNRFQNPVPKEPWPGTLDCTEYAPKCWFASQKKSDEGKFSEDCLTLNVHQGKGCEQPGAKCPVGVYIFGGDHMFGDVAEYPPQNWTDVFNITEMIIVTAGYRVGMLGFWNTGSEDALGNSALQDMVESLRWVQREIPRFGGDPDKVTLMGHSSAGMDVSAVSLSPKARGLFRSVVALSGTSQIFQEFNDVKSESKELALRCGCATEESWENQDKIPEIVACMQAIPVSELINKQTGMGADGLFTFLGARIDGPQGLFPESVEKLTQARPAYPLLTGTVQKESANTKFDVPDADETYIEAECALAALVSGLTPSKTLVEECVALYANSGLSYPEQFALLYTDILFFLPALKEALSMERQNVPVYLYQFDYVRKEIASTFPQHADDICYFLGSFGCHKPWTSNDKFMRRTHAKFLSNFVRYQNPTPDGTWKTFKAVDSNYYSIDLNPTNRNDYHGPYMRFWLHTAPRILDAAPFVSGNPNVMEKIRGIIDNPKLRNGYLLEQTDPESDPHAERNALITWGVIGALLIIGFVGFTLIKKRRNRPVDSEAAPLISN